MGSPDKSGNKDLNCSNATKQAGFPSCSRGNIRCPSDHSISSSESIKESEDFGTEEDSDVSSLGYPSIMFQRRHILSENLSVRCTI